MLQVRVVRDVQIEHFDLREFLSFFKNPPAPPSPGGTGNDKNIFPWPALKAFPAPVKMAALILLLSRRLLTCSVSWSPIGSVNAFSLPGLLRVIMAISPSSVNEVVTRSDLFLKGAMKKRLGEGRGALSSPSSTNKIDAFP